jgi:hypothetical protein
MKISSKDKKEREQQQLIKLKSGATILDRLLKKSSRRT